jgi:hypothetical protein
MVDTLHGTARDDCNISDLWLIWFGLVYGVSEENHLPAASLWQIYHIIEYTSPWTGFELTTFVVVGTDCIGSCEPNYHTITTLSDWYKANLSFIIWNAELFYRQNKLKYIRIYLPSTYLPWCNYESFPCPLCQFIWLSNLGVPDESYSGNASCALNLISSFLLIGQKSFIKI